MRPAALTSRTIFMPDREGGGSLLTDSQGLPDGLVEVITQLGITPEQLQEAISLMTAHQAAEVSQQPKPESRRLPTWRSATPYEGTTTVKVVTPSP
jgi:hypothetical protein